MWQSGVKYIAVIRITLLQHLAYIYDFLIRTLFLILILYVFSQLWLTTYEGSGNHLIEGYTIQKMMWYLVVTESIIMAFPSLIDQIEKEIKNGEIAYFLNRPISYIGFHFGQYLGEALLRVLINLVIGSLLVFMMVGGLPLSIPTLIGFVFLLLLAISIQYVSVMSLCLTAFWVEDIRGFFLIYSRLLMILGGMMVPLEIFPHWLETISRYLPFQSIIYLPSSFFVGKISGSIFNLLIQQGIWLIVFTLILTVIFRLGVKRVNVNGG